MIYGKKLKRQKQDNSGYIKAFFHKIRLYPHRRSVNNINPAESATSEVDPGSIDCVENLERVTGIEPALKAWEALILPLNYTRERYSIYILTVVKSNRKMLFPIFFQQFCYFSALIVSELLYIERFRCRAVFSLC